MDMVKSIKQLSIRYVNGNKYKSRYEMLNQVVMEYWTYGEHGVLVCLEMLSLQQNRLMTFSAYVTQAGQTKFEGIGQT